MVALIEKTHARIGNDRYWVENGSFGLTTLQDRHARKRGERVELRFRAKAGKLAHVAIDDARLARVVQRCRDIPGQRLFQYLDAAGNAHAISSTDVNDYIRDATGAEFTAKTFRTWAGSFAAARLLANCSPSRSNREVQRTLARVLEGVAEELGNTPAICRKSYVHPGILAAFLRGILVAAVAARAACARTPRAIARRGSDGRSVRKPATSAAGSVIPTAPEALCYTQAVASRWAEPSSPSGTDDVQLGTQPGCARSHFARSWALVQPRLASFFELEVFDCVGDVHRLAVDARGGESLSKTPPAGPTNGCPARSSAFPGCSPTKTTRVGGTTLAKNRLCRMPIEVAAATLVHFPLQCGDGSARRHVRLGAGFGRSAAGHSRATKHIRSARASRQIATRGA